MFVRSLLTCPEISVVDYGIGEPYVIDTLQLVSYGVQREHCKIATGLQIGAMGYGGFFKVNVDSRLNLEKFDIWQVGATISWKVDDLRSRLPGILFAYYELNPSELAVDLAFERPTPSEFERLLIDRMHRVLEDLQVGRYTGKLPR